MDLRHELYGDLERAGPERLAFVRRAYGYLPSMETPRILDAGCGNGDVTIELARLGGGEVVGIDIDGDALGIFEERIRAEQLESRVSAIHGSMIDMSLSPGSFDVIWAEGSLHIVGIERRLETMRHLLRPGGFLVMHESAWLESNPPEGIAERWKARFPEIRTLDEFKDWISGFGYDVTAILPLPREFWGKNYYRPLEQQIERLEEKYRDNNEAIAILERERQEAALYECSFRWFGSAYFFARRSEP